MKYIKDYVNNLKEDKELLISKLKEFDITTSEESLEELIERVDTIQNILYYQATHSSFSPRIQFPRDMTNYNTSFLNYTISNGENHFVGDTSVVNPLDVLDLTHMRFTGTQLYHYISYVPAKILDISTWNTSKVDTMYRPFNESTYTVLEEIRLPKHFVTSKCTAVQEIFNNCYKLKRLDLRDWDLSNCNSLYRMAYNCSSLQYLNISGWDTSNVQSFEGFLYNVGSYNSSSPEIIGLEDLNTSSAVTFRSMLVNTNIEHLNLSNWDVSRVTDASYIFSAGQNQYNNFIKDINISGWNLKSVTDLSGIFCGLGQVESIDFSNVRIPNYKGTSMSSFVYGCKNLKTLDLQCFNPEEFLENCTNVGYLIRDCFNLETANLSYLNCRPTTIDSFAYNCEKLNYLDIRNIDLKNTTSMTNAFWKVSNDCTIIVRDEIAKNKILQNYPTFKNIVIAELSEIKILNTYTNIGLNIGYVTLKLSMDTQVEEQRGVRFDIVGPATVDENYILTLTDEAKAGDSITVTVISTYDETIRDTITFEVLEELKEIEITGNISTETDLGKWLKRKTTIKGLPTYGIESIGMNTGGELKVATRGYNKMRVYVEYKGTTSSKYFEIRNVIDDSSLLRLNNSDTKVKYANYTYDINPEKSELSFIVTKVSGSIMDNTHYNACNITVEVYNE